MKLTMYAIYDLKTRVFFPPMVFHNDGHAKRDVSVEVRQGRSMMKEFPADYELFEVGEWLDDSGTAQALTPPRRVCRLDELLPRDPAVEATGKLPFPGGHSAPPTQVAGGGPIGPSE